MNHSCPEFAALRARVEAYAFDRPDEAIDFTARLRKQTGWSRRRAARAIAEYRRFAVLSVAAGHVVSPSHDVDEVWHLHLTETRRYWDEFCAEALGRPLHHDPSRGGAEEDERYHALYLRTLDSYERLFGEPAPRDVWSRPRPSALARLRQATLSRLGVVGVPALLLMSGCAVFDSSSPGAIQGPQFIIGYIFLLLVGFVVVTSWQSAVLKVSSLGSPAASSLGSYELAWLAGGRQRVLETVLLQLAQRDHVRFDRKGAKAVPNAAPPADAAPLEVAVFTAVENGKFKSNAAVKSALDQLQTRLETAGLLPSKAAVGRARMAAWVVFGPLFLLGAVRLIFGIAHHKPAGFLIVAMFIGSLAAAVMTAVLVKISPQGRRVLAEAKLATPKTTGLKEGDAALLRSLAIFGAAVVAADAFGGYRSFVGTAFAGDSGSSGGGSCGGGGGCGGGCGG